MARSNSPGDLTDFFKEFEDIECNKETDGEEEEETSKTPDEGEQEAAWLKEVGLDFLVHKHLAGKELTEDDVQALTECFPSKNVAVVKKRVETLNATLRKTQKYITKVDVRDIFPQQLSSTNDKSVNNSKMAPDNTILTKQVTKNSTSPALETAQPDFTGNKGKAPAKGHTTFMKNKGGYSMSGISKEVQDNAQNGVEMLSLHHQDSQSQLHRTLMPISDSDITFEIKLEESGHNGKTVWKMSDDNDGLPNFTLVPDKLGLTTIDDVSSADLILLKNQALLELTSMFDTHNITYYRRRTKKKFKEHGLFGVPLQMMLEYDRRLEPNTRIPLVFKGILSYLVKHGLDTEGILRVPGSTSRVKQLRQELEDEFYSEPFSWDNDLIPNDVAALMKQFLRDLPKPLLTDEYIEAFAQVENLPDKNKQLQALNLLVLLLPDEHRDTLQALLEVLEMIIQQKNTNKMTLNNVAMIMAPNLFLTPKVRSSDPTKNKTVWELEMKMAAGTSDIMRMLIQYRDILWMIPSDLISLVRRQNESAQIRKNKEKNKMKFLAKKDKTDVYKKPALKHEADFQDGVIRIQAPNLTKSSTTIQLDSSTTAGDIVARFRVNQHSNENSNAGQQFSHHGYTYSHPSFHSAGEGFYLFEVGGNIGERCLQNNTNMMLLYKVNPNAEWIIKQQQRLKVL